MPKSFRTRLQNRERLIGTVITLSDPAVAEICIAAGVDWLFVDMEHSPLEISDVARIIRTAGSTCDVVVRVPAIDEVWAKRVLDLGASGLIFPQVKTALEASTIVTWCKYAPTGSRSLGIARAQGYGSQLTHYLATANDTVAVILLIEHVNAIENLYEILDVPGIDGLFLGPFDLSASLGKPGQIDHPLVVEAIEKFKVGCESRSMPCGIFARDVEAARKVLRDPFSFLAVGMDCTYLLNSVKNSLAEVKG